MCSHYVRHVAALQRFENEYADMSCAESFSAKLYINVFTIYIILRFFNINSHEGFYGLYKCST